MIASAHLERWPREFRRQVTTVAEEFFLDLSGIHGFWHWTRVLENGLMLAATTGADRAVVTAFALFHDSQRFNEGLDPLHGRRGAEYAKEHRTMLNMLDDEAFDLFFEACDRHSDGLIDADITVQTCWDADRLDLGRIGIRPDPERLCTEIAKRKDVIDAAWRRSNDWVEFGSDGEPLSHHHL